MPSNLASLMRLPAEQRVRLAMALWESLEDGQRATEIPLTVKQRAEIDRRLAEHLDDPRSAVPWTEVRRKLRTRE